MFQAFRVTKERLVFGDWQYGPSGACQCQTDEPGCQETCGGRAGTTCECSHASRCACGIPKKEYAGDIIVLASGHDRLPGLISAGHITPDASIDGVDELLQQEKYRRLIRKSDQVMLPEKTKKEPAGSTA